MHVSFDEFIINCVHIKKQINGLHIPIKKIYNYDFSGFFCAILLQDKKKAEINMEIMIGIWYFLFEDNLKQFQKILYLL